MEPIRILHVVTEMERAGLETMIMNYYRNVDRSKVQFDFLQHRNGFHAFDSEIEEMGGKIYHVPPFNPLNSNGYLTELDLFFREHTEYKIVHSHLDCLSAVPLRFAKKYGVKSRIAHSHVSKMSFDYKYPVRMFYRSIIPHYATDFFACSEDAGKWMFHNKRFKVIKNAISCDDFLFDIEEYENIRKKYNLVGKFVVGHVGRFDPVKNHSFLIEVFYEILKRKNNSILLLAGEGKELSHIKELVRKLGISEKVIFLGSISNVSEIVKAFDTFVFPSLYEGLGISLIEAQAAGVPCFASLEGVPQSANITGSVKYLSLSLKASDWAEVISHTTIDFSNRIGHNMLVKNSGYDIKIESKKLENLYVDYYRR